MHWGRGRDSARDNWRNANVGEKANMFFWFWSFQRCTHRMDWNAVYDSKIEPDPDVRPVSGSAGKSKALFDSR